MYEMIHQNDNGYLSFTDTINNSDIFKSVRSLNDLCFSDF